MRCALVRREASASRVLCSSAASRRSVRSAGRRSLSKGQLRRRRDGELDIAGACWLWLVVCRAVSDSSSCNHKCMFMHIYNIYECSLGFGNSRGSLKCQKQLKHRAATVLAKGEL